MATANVKSTKVCAFCKYWWDPAFKCVEPKSPNIGIWEYTSNARNMCLKTGIEKNAGNFCGKYSCRIPS